MEAPPAAGSRGEPLLAGRFLPYALARSLEMAIPPAVQFAVALLAGPAEGGRFYPLLAVAMVLFALVDLGASRAFPALAGSGPAEAHPLLRGILGWRWLAGGLLGAGLLLLPSGVLQPWGLDHASRWPLLLFVAGRLQLTACQGFAHGRAAYPALARAALGQVAVLAALLTAIWLAGRLDAGSALTALGLSAWIGVWQLHDRRIWPRGARSLLLLPFRAAGRAAARQVWPLAWASVAGSLYPRLDALIGGWFLEPAALGTYALLDASYRLLLAPGGMAAQTVFPDLRAAAARRSPAALQAGLGDYFRGAWPLGAGVGVFGALAAWVLAAADPAVAPVAVAFAASLPLTLPNSILPPLWLSLGWEDEWALYAGSVTVLRLAVGAAACAWWGGAGLAWTHFGLEASACLGFWGLWRRRFPSLWPVPQGAGPARKPA